MVADEGPREEGNRPKESARQQCNSRCTQGDIVRLEMLLRHRYSSRAMSVSGEQWPSDALILEPGAGQKKLQLRPPLDF
jgi:hypothetical protein